MGVTGGAAVIKGSSVPVNYVNNPDLRGLKLALDVSILIVTLIKGHSRALLNVMMTRRPSLSPLLVSSGIELSGCKGVATF